MQAIANSVTGLRERVLLTLPNMDSHTDWLTITELCCMEFLNQTTAVFFNRQSLLLKLSKHHVDFIAIHLMHVAGN